jgi:nicotinamidase-related amidase
MPIDVRPLVDPARTALVTMEVQGSVLGAGPALPALAEVARQGTIAAIARLVRAARARGVPVVHCVAVRRADGRGASRNTRLQQIAHGGSRTRNLPGTPDALPLPEIGLAESDIVLGRMHGIGPMGGTDLAPVLRNLGVSSIVGVGVSLNVGMASFATDAVNQGFVFVIPRDAVCGVPREYGEMMLEHTYRFIATLTRVDDVIAAWDSYPR